MNERQEAINALQKEMLQILDKQISELEFELEMVTDVMMSHGWIVVCDGVPLKFDVNKSLEVVGTNPCPTPATATRFVKKDAVMLANSTQNGRGTKGEAMFVKDAIQASVNESKERRENLVARRYFPCTRG